MPSSNMYDSMLGQLLGTGAFGQNDQAVARRMASEGSDARLRGQLGSKRKLKEGDSAGPSGSYALAKYPELSRAVEWLKTGNMPLTAGGGMGAWLEEQQDPALRDRNSKKRKQWAAQQSKLLGGRY